MSMGGRGLGSHAVGLNSLGEVSEEGDWILDRFSSTIRTDTGQQHKSVLHQYTPFLLSFLPLYCKSHATIHTQLAHHSQPAGSVCVCVCVCVCARLCVTGRYSTEEVTASSGSKVRDTGPGQEQGNRR